MKVEITEKGVYLATGKTNKAPEPVEKGTIIDVNAEVIPGYLVGKCRVVAEEKGRQFAAGGKVDDAKGKQPQQ